MKRKFLLWLISFAVTGIFVICIIYGYITAKSGIEQYIDVRDNKTDVPYDSATPENFGISLNLPKGERIVFLFDFELEEIGVEARLPEDDPDGANEEKYNVAISYALFGDIVDRVGGINITQGEEDVRLTGVTAAEILCENGGERSQILPSFIEAVSKSGLSRSDLLYITENCDSTDLSLIDLFPLKDRLTAMIGNIRVLS